MDFKVIFNFKLWGFQSLHTVRNPLTHLSLEIEILILIFTYISYEKSI